MIQEEIEASGWYEHVWQSFAVLLPVRSVGVMGDERTYDQVIAAAGRGKRGRHDGGLGKTSLRGAGADFKQDHK